MADGTSIEWAKHPVTGRGATWNPLLARDIVTGKLGYHCEHVTEACRHCYAETFNQRNLPNRGTGYEFKPGHQRDIEIVLDPAMLELPLRWKQPRGIFVCSMTDLFGEFVPRHMVDRMFAIMAMAPQHVYFVLTKRPKRAAAYTLGAGTRVAPEAHVKYLVDQFAKGGRQVATRVVWPLPNVWLGTSVHDQASAESFIPELLNARAAVHWISAEPLLGPIDLQRLQNATDKDSSLDAFAGGRFTRADGGPGAGWNMAGLKWVVAGGESGAHARPSNPQWFRDLRDQCAGAAVPYFFKQWGEWVSVSEQEGGGRHHTFPDGRSVRRIGRSKATHALDGIIHDAMPGVK